MILRELRVLMHVACPSCQDDLDVPDEQLCAGVVRVKCGHCSFAFVIRLGAPSSIPPPAAPATPPGPVEGLKTSGTSSRASGEIGGGAQKFIAADTRTSIYLDDGFRQEIEIGRSGSAGEGSAAPEHAPPAAGAISAQDTLSRGALSPGEKGAETAECAATEVGQLADAARAAEAAWLSDARGAAGPLEPPDTVEMGSLAEPQEDAAAGQGALPPSELSLRSEPASSAPAPETPAQVPAAARGPEPPAGQVHAPAPAAPAPASYLAPWEAAASGQASASPIWHAGAAVGDAPAAAGPAQGAGALPVFTLGRERSRDPFSGVLRASLVPYAGQESDPYGLSDQSRGKGARVFGALFLSAIALFVLLFLFVLARNDWAIDAGDVGGMIDRAFGGRPRAFAESDELRGLELSGPAVEEARLAGGERALAASGLVKNNDTRDRRYIYVRVELQDRRGRRVSSVEVPGGNIFSREQLAQLSKTDLRSRLTPAGSDGSNAHVVPGQAIAYMAVLANLPPDFSPERYRVHAVVSQAELPPGH